MDSKDFKKKMNNAQELMVQEEYKEALIILEKLKKIERNSDFDYNLTHKLYQLISNARSLYNQQRILKVINKISEVQKLITFEELRQVMGKEESFKLDLEVLKKETELLILRGVLECKIELNSLVFS